MRPYQPGDQLRRVHWKATARLGVPVSRRYDPAREREVLIAVDMQTMPGLSWMLNWDDDLVEGAVRRGVCRWPARSWATASRSVSRSMPSATVRSGRCSCRPGQERDSSRPWPICSPTSARSRPCSFDRLLADVARRAPMGCSVIALSSRDPIEFVPTLRRLRAQGYAVTVAAFGPDAGVSCARARSARCASAGYRLDPDWQTADALERVA